MFPQTGPQTGQDPTVSAINQQNVALLGTPQIQMSAGHNNPLMPGFDPQMANSTQPNQNMQNMIKALQGHA